MKAVVARLVLVASLYAAPLALAAEPANPLDPLRALFSDMPQYLNAPPFRPGMRTPPRPIAGDPPTQPRFLQPGETVVVVVAVAINETGNVAAARVVESSDPRCDASALAAVATWKFAPAMGEAGPIKCVAHMPIHFRVSPDAAVRPQVTIGISPFAYDMRGMGLSAPLAVRGDSLETIKGARVTVTRAIDNTGESLTEGQPAPRFFNASVGGGTEKAQHELALSGLSLRLRKPSSAATHLAILEGHIELVVPTVDPLAVAHLPLLPETFGQSVVSEALAAAGVTVTLLDKTAAVHALTDPQDVLQLRELIMPLPELARLPGWRAPVSAESLHDQDVVVLIDDPDGRLVGVEFQTFRSETLDYNLNGHTHVEGMEGRRLAIYRMRAPLPEDSKLVCWLATPQATVTQAFALSNLELPRPPAAGKSP